MSAADARINFRVGKGVLAPQDEFARERLREKGYRQGDIVAADLFKERTSYLNRRAHAFGKLLTHHLDAFDGMTAHTALKRVQIESNAHCDEIGLNFPGMGPCVYRIPKSFNFKDTDEAAFKAAFGSMCAHVRKRYWPELQEDQIDEMVKVMMEPIV